MTLFRQLFIGSAVLFLVLLLGIECVYLANAKYYLQDQLASQSQNAATSLALSIGSRGSLVNPALAETTINPVFNRGYFRSIKVVSTAGAIIASKDMPVAEGDVPAWFVGMFPLRTPVSESIISSGWNELGRVFVVSHPHFVYHQLWHAWLDTAAWLAIAFLLALIGLRIFLAGILRPLRAIEDTASAISERDFRTVAIVPRARELRRVVLAINNLATKIRKVIEEESVRAERLHKANFEDPVTALYTRRGLEEKFSKIAIHGNGIHSGILILLQIDNLKQINDRHGHARADELLARIAHAITEGCADRAVLTARLTGGDFAIAALNLDQAEATTLLSDISVRVRACLESEFGAEETAFHYGAVHFAPDEFELSALLSSADLALARAHERESGAFEVVYTHDVRGPVRGSREWRHTIENALAADRMPLYAQPALALPGRGLLHHEVLVRLLDDHGNVVPAAGFVPMVARHDLLPRLDLTIIEKLLAQADSEAQSSTTIAVNVAAQTITNWTAVEQLLELLRAYPKITQRFVFEITELGAVRNPEATLAFASKVRALRAGIAIDNFGLHQTALSQLPALLPAYVKLAAEFTRSVVENADTRLLITSIARVAQPLDILLIAQAVDNAAVLNLLEELGVGGYQGFICGEPAPFHA